MESLITMLPEQKENLVRLIILQAYSVNILSHRIFETKSDSSPAKFPTESENK